MAQLDLSGLVIRPGDTLILCLGRDATPEMFENFQTKTRETIKDRMPDVEVLVIGGIEQLAVYRPGDEA